MISLTYGELAAIDEALARRMLLEAYHDLGGNLSQSARDLSCSRSTVRKWVRRHKLSQTQKKRGKFRAIRTHDSHSLCPLQHFQVDLKHNLDLKSLPKL